MEDTTDQNIDSHDHRLQHCRMLGHKVPFNYCRSMNADLPCGKILDCWKNIFPIDEFIRKNYTDTEIAAFLAPPKPKLAHIYELMKKAEGPESK